jgi:hypothetical protein
MVWNQYNVIDMASGLFTGTLLSRDADLKVCLDLCLKD